MLLFQLLYIYQWPPLSIVPDTKIRDLPAFRPAKKDRIATLIGLKTFLTFPVIGLKIFLTFLLICRLAFNPSYPFLWLAQKPCNLSSDWLKIFFKGCRSSPTVKSNSKQTGKKENIYIFPLSNVTVMVFNCFRKYTKAKKCVVNVLKKFCKKTARIQHISQIYKDPFNPYCPVRVDTRKPPG